MKEKLCQPGQGAAAAPYPHRTVVDHQLDVPERAGLILGEHGARDRAGRVQQQAAFVPGHQRASPQVGADEPRRPIVLVKGVPLVPQRHDMNGPTEQRGARGEGAWSARGALQPEQEVRGRRAERTGTSPSPRAQHARGGRDNSRTAARTYMISNPRAGRRRGEMRLPTPERPLRDVFTRDQLIPRRDSLACLHRGAGGRRRAGPRQAASTGAGGARVRPSAGPASQEVRGNILGGRAAPRLRAAGAAAGSRREPGRCSPLPPRSLGRPDSCRLLLLPPPLLLLLLAGGGLGEKLGLRPLGGAGAARAGLGGRAAAGDALPAEAPEPRWRRMRRSGPRGAPRTVND